MATQEQSSINIHNRVILGNFSVDEHGDYRNDDGKRKFFVRPGNEPDFDIAEGKEEFVPYEEYRPRMLDNLLNWIKDHRQRMEECGLLQKLPESSHLRLGVDFVSRRGMFGKLLRAAYNPEKIEIFVTLYRGTLYLLKAFALDEDGLRVNPIRKQQEVETGIFEGFKFRQLVTSLDGNQPKTDLPVDAFDTYYAVIKTAVGKETLLFSKEIHGELQDSEDPPPENYVVIKTCKDSGELPWRKRIYWWTQWYLTGIPHVVCGFRDDQQHTISSVKYHKVDDLVADARLITPEYCLQKFNSLLSDIKEKITDDDQRSVYHLVLEEITEQGREKYRKLEDRKFVLKGRREEDFVLINDWFIEDVLGGE